MLTKWNKLYTTHILDNSEKIPNYQFSVVLTELDRTRQNQTEPVTDEWAELLKFL